jgi:hypothetical protein
MPKVKKRRTPLKCLPFRQWRLMKKKGKQTHQVKHIQVLREAIRQCQMCEIDMNAFLSFDFLFGSKSVLILVHGIAESLSRAHN